MELKKREWPDVGDLVIATVVGITDYGAYVRLDEYEKEGLLHVSEVASRWVRNIRVFVREGQKVVLKVLRVNAEKGHVDLSLRRVTKREKKEKILSWKKDRKADTLLRSASEKLNISFEEIYEKAGALIEKEFGELHEGLEKTAKDGADVLLKLGVPTDIAVALEEIAKERISIQLVKVKGILELQCTKPNGAVLIKETLLRAQKIGESQGTRIRIYVVAPPKYRVEVSAEDYKSAEDALEKATNTALKNIAKIGGKGAFKREK
ncbi:MAG: translation initiation factor IF-2 subunit alpha [Candidatus Bathyarchaeota archaeon]|nr:translation initiation factor IF-2 subunit alpha [Candidatus Bathyarchaeota archaeon]MDH5635972.1 translation initiation factor IF-2 subunit alpha [Candidatus Bathyarchaeota archaeon]MDH5701499.1 translation initiation factor IF-2 subunit alpha [Candidatus Bathyarchaeota archaeon]